MRYFTIIIGLFISSSIFAQTFNWTPQTSGVTSYLRDVYFTDSQTGWAVGDAGVILNTTNGGNNWIKQTSGTSEPIREVFFINSSVGWAVGGTSTLTMLKTVNGGGLWQDLAPGNISDNQILDVAFANANTGWAMTSDSIYITKDGGTNWENEAYTANVSMLSNKGLAVATDSTAFVAGQNKRVTPSNSYADVFNRRPDNAPLFWGPSAASQFQTDDNLRSIEFSDATTGYAGGERGILYKLEVIGPQLSGPWNVNLDLNPPALQIINSISFPTASRGFFTSSTEILGTTYALIYHTADAAVTWSPSPDNIQDFFTATIHAPDATHAWLVGVGGKIYKGTPVTIGINEPRKSLDISVSPNPSYGFVKVNIISQYAGDISYSLIDISGREVDKGNRELVSSNSNFTLDLSGHIKGLYFLKINTKNRHTVLPLALH